MKYGILYLCTQDQIDLEVGNKQCDGHFDNDSCRKIDGYYWWKI